MKRFHCFRRNDKIGKNDTTVETIKKTVTPTIQTLDRARSAVSRLVLSISFMVLTVSINSPIPDPGLVVMLGTGTTGAIISARSLHRVTHLDDA